jgi:hypothetical protein
LRSRFQGAHGRLFSHMTPRSRRACRASFAITSRPHHTGCSATQDGSRECRAPDAPAALRAKVESTQASHHGHTGIARHSPRNGFNDFLRTLPGDRACLPPSPAEILFRQLDTSVGVSGPYDFAVRKVTLSSVAPPASTASRPASVTIASRPFVGQDGERYAGDLGRKGMGIFFDGGLDYPNRVDGAGVFVLTAHGRCRVPVCSWRTN